MDPTQFATMMASINEQIYATIGLTIAVIWAVTWKG
jgi:hypothetical protein